MDLRKLLGERGADEEMDALVESLHARRADHVRWVNELEACVREARSFALQLDPTKCAFGRWYGTYVAPDAVLRTKLRSFDAPHRHIHALADRALGLASSGCRDDALALIDAERHGALAALLALFDATIPMIAHSLVEILVECRTPSGTLGLIADDAISIAELELSTSVETSYTRMATHGDVPTLLLDVDAVGTSVGGG